MSSNETFLPDAKTEKDNKLLDTDGCGKTENCIRCAGCEQSERLGKVYV